MSLPPPGPALDPEVRVTLNFHPDRLVRGVPILCAPAEDGTYHSQFVTGASNGGLTAHPGGGRRRWESGIFGGVYDEASAPERPVYGALNFRRQAVGAPRGSAPRTSASPGRPSVAPPSATPTSSSPGGARAVPSFVCGAIVAGRAVPCAP